MSVVQKHQGRLRPIHDHVIVTQMSFGERKTNSGIILLADDGKSSGIRPRWAKVYAVGHDQTEVSVGQWILISHGRWTRAAKLVDPEQGEILVHRVDNNDILAVSDECPNFDETLNGNVV